MSDLLYRLGKASHVIISGHVRPDGDCIGSCMGLYTYIKDNFKQVQVDVILDPIPQSFSYLLPEGFQLCHEGRCDLFISLDCGALDRLNEDAQKAFSKAYKTVSIDHHKTNERFADLNYVVADSSSTCEILYELLDDKDISKQTAMALYTGIIHDTGVFKHDNTSVNTMTIAGKLMSKGIPFGKIIDESFYMKTFKQTQIMGRCLLASIRLMEGKVICAVVTKKVMDFYEATPDDLSGVIDQLRTTEGVEVAILLDERMPGEYKVSMRSNNLVDVSTVAQFFGGGGHAKAAGCAIKGTQYDVINNLTEHISNQLKE